MHVLSRRDALLRLASVGGALALSAFTPTPAVLRAEEAHSDDGRDDELPPPGRSGLEHIVVVMMENRSFDHFLGWLPQANGKQAGLHFADKQGVVHPTHALAPDFQGCGFADPDHSFEGGRIEYDHGRCDGWLRAGANDSYSIGYYERDDLPFIGQIATRFTTPDHYFCAILGPTFPNRIYQHAAQTDRLSNTLAISTLPTIWDRLATAGIPARYYFSDLPVVALWGTKYLAIARPFTSFLADAGNGTLPAVSYIDPGFLGEINGTSNDDHPHGDIRNGEAFLDSIYRAVTTGPAWHNTLLIINFDEWGGFFDHVPPPVGAVTEAERALGYTDGLRGFRVPCLVISPWSQHGGVPHQLYDHTSILKLIEWRYSLPPLGVRDAAARNLAHLLDFARPRLGVFQPTVPTGPFGGACPPSPAGLALRSMAVSTGSENKWTELQALARSTGWPI